MIQEFVQEIDLWTIFGFVGQVLFFSRFILQWIVSERAGRSVVPPLFWYLSAVGAAILLVYSIHLRDIVFVAGFSLSLIIYFRNIILEKKHKRAAVEN